MSLPVGNHPGNTGGKKGRSGRKPDAFKNFLAKLRQDPTALAALKAAASDSESRAFGSAWKLISEYDENKPAEKRQIVGPIEVRVRVIKEGRRITAS